MRKVNSANGSFYTSKVELLTEKAPPYFMISYLQLSHGTYEAAAKKLK